MPLSEAQTKYYFSVFCAVAPLSVLGSSLTLITIYRTKAKKQKKHRPQKQGRGRRRSSNNIGAPGPGAGPGTTTTTNTNTNNKLTTYHRLLVGLSIMDLFFSIALMFGPLPMPAELGIPGAHGTTRTCTVQAFFTQLGVGSFCYSQMLMLYFVLVIRYNMRESVIERRVEPIMHLVPIVFYFGSAIAGLVLEVFNPSGNTCWVGTYPVGCEADPDVQCIRPPIESHEMLYGFSMVTIPFMVWSFLILLWLLVVVVTVVQQHRKNRRWLFRPAATASSNSNNVNSTNSGFNIGTAAAAAAAAVAVARGGQNQQQSRRSSSSSSSSTISSAQTRRTARVVVQCLLYATWFIAVMIMGTLNTLFSATGREYRNQTVAFVVVAVALFLLPLQGLVNFLIYIRPYYLSIRREFRDQGRWFAIREAVWYPSASRRDRKQRAESSSKSNMANSSEEQTDESHPTAFAYSNRNGIVTSGGGGDGDDAATIGSSQKNTDDDEEVQVSCDLPPMMDDIDENDTPQQDRSLQQEEAFIIGSSNTTSLEQSHGSGIRPINNHGDNNDDVKSVSVENQATTAAGDDKNPSSLCEGDANLPV